MYLALAETDIIGPSMAVMYVFGWESMFIIDT